MIEAIWPHSSITILEEGIGVAEIGLPRSSEYIVVSNSPPYKKSSFVAFHNRLDFVIWKLIFDYAVNNKLLSRGEASIIDLFFAKIRELEILRQLDGQNIRHYPKTNIFSWSEPSIGQYWGRSKSEILVLINCLSNIYRQIGAHLFGQNSLHQDSVIFSGIGNFFHGVRGLVGYPQGNFHIFSLSLRQEEQSSSSIPQRCGKPCYSNGSEDYKKLFMRIYGPFYVGDEREKRAIGAIVIVFVYFGLLSLFVGRVRGNLEDISSIYEKNQQYPIEKN